MDIFFVVSLNAVSLIPREHRVIAEAPMIHQVKGLLQDR